MREVWLTDGVRQELEAACLRRLPEETCGLVYGSRQDGSIHADGFAVVRNASPVPQKTFVFDPGDWVAAFYESQRNRRSIVGFFHSHPNGSLTPSVQDAAGWLPWGTYWIIALSAGGFCEFAVYEPNADGCWVQCLLK